MSTFFVRFIALSVRFSTFLKKVSNFFAFSPPSVHKSIEHSSFNAEQFTLHISNDRFWAKRQGVHTNFFRSKMETIYDENARQTLLPDMPCYIVLQKKIYNSTHKVRKFVRDFYCKICFYVL